MVFSTKRRPERCGAPLGPATREPERASLRLRHLRLDQLPVSVAEERLRPKTPGSYSVDAPEIASSSRPNGALTYFHIFTLTFPFFGA
jgi:hypothetical protein